MSSLFWSLLGSFLSRAASFVSARWCLARLGYLSSSDAREIDNGDLSSFQALSFVFFFFFGKFYFIPNVFADKLCDPSQEAKKILVTFGNSVYERVKPRPTF